MDTKVSDALSNLTNLRDLRTESYNHISVSDYILAPLTNLTTLHLGSPGCYIVVPWGSSSRSITDDSLSLLTNLRSLSITSSCGATKLSLTKLTNLTELSFCHSNISDIAISPLTKLQSLYLSRCEHLQGRGLHTLVNLTYLDISQNPQLTDDCLQNLQRVETLEILGNPKFSPSGLAHLPVLKRLALSTGPNMDEIMSKYPDLIYI